MRHKLRLILLAGVMVPSQGIVLDTMAEQNIIDASATMTLKEQGGNIAGLVDIGGGRKMYLECQGNGLPTVVLVSGRTDRGAIWKTSADPAKPAPDVFSEVAKFTRVCAYDRPGTVTITAHNTVEPGRSSPVPQPTTPKDGVADLHALLTKANVPGPYVLVGHSYGGLIARLYASTYPQEVCGLVLIDALTEQLYDALTPVQQQLWIRLNSHYSKELDSYTIQEKTNFAPGFEQLRSAPAFQPIPAIVLTSDQPYDFQSLIAKGILPSDTPIDFGPVVFQAHLKAQEHLARLLHAKHMTRTHAGHYIQNEQPQLVIDAIRQVVSTAREKGNVLGSG